ncbi:MAG: hypothetical protein J07HN4v3_01805 [Halonotius sp. J07HN4]|nr:MAG: hypothetical protein J07HN4v3_01805 [Halonotius sp. J07HN4]
MTDFDLDLREAEAQLDDMPSDEVMLGVLNGETEDAEWVQSITQGTCLSSRWRATSTSWLPASPARSGYGRRAHAFPGVSDHHAT